MKLPQTLPCWTNAHVVTTLHVSLHASSASDVVVTSPMTSSPGSDVTAAAGTRTAWKTDTADASLVAGACTARRGGTDGPSSPVVKVDRRIRWHYTVYLSVNSPELFFA